MTVRVVPTPAVLTAAIEVDAGEMHKGLREVEAAIRDIHRLVNRSGGGASGDNLRRYLTDKVMYRANEAAKAGGYAAANQVVAEAVERAPLDVGTLRGDGVIVQPPEKHGDTVRTEFGFAGGSDDYAVIQHEALEFQHDVGEAKFLEKAMRNQAPRVPGVVAAVARRHFEKSGG